MTMWQWLHARFVAPHRGRHRQIVASGGIALSIAYGGLCTLPAAASPSPATDPDYFPDQVWSQPASLAGAPSTHFLDPDPATQVEPAAAADGYRWRGPPDTQPDWQGVGRDTAYFLGYQALAMVVLYLAPESITGWETEEKDNYSFDKWRENVSEPVWDEDVWWLNYITHPYWGATYYTRARERGLNRAQAFWYSALLSTIWEYGPEALAEPVSIQDLVVTPVAGALVGEYLFSPLRARIRSKPGALDWQDKTLLFLTDPLGVLNAGTDRMLGVKTTLSLQPISLRAPALGAGTSPDSRRSARTAAQAWGLQLQVDW